MSTLTSSTSTLKYSTTSSSFLHYILNTLLLSSEVYRMNDANTKNKHRNREKGKSQRTDKKHIKQNCTKKNIEQNISKKIH